MTRLFREGKYALRAEADVRVPALPTTVVVQAITEQFVIVRSDDDPAETAIARDDFERDYYLVPIFHSHSGTLFGSFVDEGVRKIDGNTSSGSGFSADWVIDLAKVPESAYLKGWQP